ncbi:zinc-dependent metalloprotease [Nakamurella leprariae]|uniref:zinc-dependent metalloprotease n=1 Tax=Nakamurella leprariae TaxID=2803911 RepID=UPI002E2850DF|nr:zinc-dependent metalloprotease [Nakamurella leprariae]
MRRSTGSGSPGQGPIDWQQAVRTGQRLVPTGPRLSAGEAAAVVESLRRFSVEAETATRHTTGLDDGRPPETAEVVDRRGWVAATAGGMEQLIGPLAERLVAAAGGPDPDLLPGGAVARPLGATLALLSGKVLGQYDPLSVAPGATTAGRLLLVAPNVVKVHRTLQVDPDDFGLWVCLHESTHRLQFRAVPWMPEHFRALVARQLEAAYPAGEDADGPGPLELLSRVRSVLGERPGRRARSGAPEPDTAWIRRMGDPALQVVFDELMAFMALLEGHADFVMDAVGPSVIPTVGRIRTAFDARRARRRGLVDRVLHQLLGMDQKMAQYVKGAAFVREVVDRVGMDQFNAVWTSPATLPTAAEITDPPSWITRVLG